MKTEELEILKETISNHINKLDKLVRAKNNITKKLGEKIHKTEYEMEVLQKIYYKHTGKWVV